MSDNINDNVIKDDDMLKEELKAELKQKKMELEAVAEAIDEEFDEVVDEALLGAENTVKEVNKNIKWYVVHTYSGYENKVKANIEKIVENRNMQDVIVDVVVPVQDVLEIKNGQKKNVQRKVYPGYVLIKMEMNDKTWYVVRNTRGVTSFVGPGSKPVALTEDEAHVMGIELKEIRFDVKAGDAVKVIHGPFESSVGVIKEVNAAKKTVTVMLSIFGRETPVELAFSQILKL